MACLTLCALPLAAQAIGFLTVGLGMAEPFQVLLARDAAVFVGAPIAMVALAIVWWRMALRRRLHRMLVYAVLAWFAFWLFGAIGELMRYLREPWNM